MRYSLLPCLVFLLGIGTACQQQEREEDDLNIQREEDYRHSDYYERRNLEAPAQNDPIDFDRNVLDLDDLRRDE